MQNTNQTSDGLGSELLTKRELAGKIKRHTRSVDLLVASGCPKIRVRGLGVRFHWASVESWIMGQQKTGNPKETHP